MGNLAGAHLVDILRHDLGLQDKLIGFRNNEHQGFARPDDPANGVNRKLVNIAGDWRLDYHPLKPRRHGELALRYEHARADQFDLWAEPGVFTQANPAVNDLLVEAVLAALPLAGTRVLELHAGVGNFSLPLALAGAELYTAEHMQRAVGLAQRNAQQAGVRLHAFYVEDIDALLPGGPVPPLATFDAVLLNPPRVGAFEVAKLLAAGGPGRLAYVSCDPATLARDAQALVEGGYRIRAATAFDMFPQTPHVEVLLSMERR